MLEADIRAWVTYCLWGRGAGGVKHFSRMLKIEMRFPYESSELNGLVIVSPGT